MHILETSLKDNPPTQRTPRTEGLAQTCAIIHCHTGHRGLKSMTEELGVPELPTSGSASLFKLKHCGIQFPTTSVWTAHTQSCPYGPVTSSVFVGKNFAAKPCNHLFGRFLFFVRRLSVEVWNESQVSVVRMNMQPLFRQARVSLRLSSEGLPPAAPSLLERRWACFSRRLPIAPRSGSRRTN